MMSTLRDEGMKEPMLSSTCDEIAIEEFVSDFTNHAGKYGIYHDIMDITVIPMIPVMNPQQLVQMNGAQREGEKLRHILYADHTQGMKRATADLHHAVRGNTRARNALETQRRLLNLPNGQNPHVVLMLEELRRVFNPVSLVNAGDKEETISTMRLAVGAWAHLCLDLRCTWRKNSRCSDICVLSRSELQKEGEFS